MKRYVIHLTPDVDGDYYFNSDEPADGAMLVDAVEAEARIGELEAMLGRAVVMLDEYELFNSEDDMMAAHDIADEVRALLKVGQP